MGCGTPTLPADTWATLMGGDWTNYKIAKGGTVYWWAVEDDDSGGDPWLGAWVPHVDGQSVPPNTYLCKITQSDWNTIKNGSHSGDYNMVLVGENGYCVTYYDDGEDEWAKVELYEEP